MGKRVPGRSANLIWPRDARQKNERHHLYDQVPPAGPDIDDVIFSCTHHVGEFIPDYIRNAQYGSNTATWLKDYFRLYTPLCYCGQAPLPPPAPQLCSRPPHPLPAALMHHHLLRHPTERGVRSRNRGREHLARAAGRCYPPLWSRGLRSMRWWRRGGSS